jgi:hypothetical protein
MGRIRVLTEPTHREAWAGALLCFNLYAGLFILGHVGPDYAMFHFLRAVMLAMAVALFCIGWQLREREKDEAVFDLILSERERRLRGERRDAA